MGRKRSPPQANTVREIATTLARERPDLDQADYIHLIYARRLGMLLDRIDDQFCQNRFGIGSADMRVLRELRRSGAPYALRPTELFRALLITSGAITKQVDRLAAAGLVERSPDPSHGGGFLVRLTPRGFAIADDWLTALAGAGPIAGDPPLGVRERQKLASLCEKMLVAIEQRLAGR